MQRIEFQMIKKNMIEDVVLIAPNNISEGIIQYYLRFNKYGNRLNKKTKKILDRYRNEGWSLPYNAKFLIKDLKKKAEKDCECVFCKCSCPECGEWDGVEVVFMPRFEMKNTERNILNFDYWFAESYCTLYCSHCDKEFDRNQQIVNAITNVLRIDGFSIGQIETKDGMRAVKC